MIEALRGGATILLTGLTSSGKSSKAKEILRELEDVHVVNIDRADRCDIFSYQREDRRG